MTTKLKEQLREAYPKTCKILQVGRWQWIYFETKPSKIIRTALKQEARWNSRRMCWQISNGCKARFSKAGSKAILKKYQAVEV